MQERNSTELTVRSRITETQNNSFYAAELAKAMTQEHSGEGHTAFVCQNCFGSNLSVNKGSFPSNMSTFVD